MPSLSMITRIILAGIATIAGVIAGVIGNVLSTSAIYFFTKRGRKPANQPAGVWIAFFVSATVFVVLGSIAAISTTPTPQQSGTQVPSSSPSPYSPPSSTQTHLAPTKETPSPRPAQASPSPAQTPGFLPVTFDNAHSLQVISTIPYPPNSLPSGGLWISEYEGGILALGFTDGNIGLWSIATQKPIPIAAPHQAAITDLQFSPTNPDLLVSASRDTSMKLWRAEVAGFLLDKDRNNQNAIRRIDNDVFINALAFSPDGRTLAAGLTGNRFALFSMNIYSFVALQTVTPNTNNENTDSTNSESVVTDLAFSPQGDLLAIASSDWSIYLWQFNGDDNSLVYKRSISITNSALELAFSKAGLDLLAIGSLDGRILVYDLEDLTAPVYKFKFPLGETRDISWSAQGDVLAACSDKGPTYILDPVNAGSYELPAGFRKSFGCAFSPDGKLIAVAGEKGISIFGVPANANR